MTLSLPIYIYIYIYVCVCIGISINSGRASKRLMATQLRSLKHRSAPSSTVKGGERKSPAKWANSCIHSCDETASRPVRFIYSVSACASSPGPENSLSSFVRAASCLLSMSVAAAKVVPSRRRPKRNACIPTPHARPAVLCVRGVLCARAHTRNMASASARVRILRCSARFEKNIKSPSRPKCCRNSAALAPLPLFPPLSFSLCTLFLRICQVTSFSSSPFPRPLPLKSTAFFTGQCVYTFKRR